MHLNIGQLVIALFTMFVYNTLCGKSRENIELEK